MTLGRLVLAFIARRPLTWGFHALNLAVAVAALGVVLLTGRAAEDRLARDLAGIDLVVGPAGSPTQLILSSVLHADVPRGNVDLATLEPLIRHPLVAAAVPVGLGDTAGGSPVVGTIPAFLDLYRARLASGRLWAAPFEAVLGAGAARDGGLAVGDRFLTQHGTQPGGATHAAHPFVVVGVLAPTGSVADRLVLTSLDSIWQMHAPAGEDAQNTLGDHGHDDAHDHAHDHGPAHEAGTDHDHATGGQATALLIRNASPMAAVTLPAIVARSPALQAASPAREALRLREVLGSGASLLGALGAGLIALSGIGFAVALGGAVAARRPDLALLRALGMAPSRLLALVLAEGAVLGLLAGVAGWLLARATLLAALQALPGSFAPVPPALGPIDLLLLLGPVGVGLLVAVVPGLLAARVDPVRELKGG